MVCYKCGYKLKIKYIRVYLFRKTKKYIKIKL